MRILLTALLGLFFSFTHLNAQHSVYASSFSIDPDQTIAFSGSFDPINFNFDQPQTPNHIIHSEADTSLFQIERKGVYLISWSVIFFNTIPDIATLRLVNVTSSLPFNPEQSVSILAGTDVNLSGEVIAVLDRDTVLQLQAESETATTENPLHIVSPIITISRID